MLQQMLEDIQKQIVEAPNKPALVNESGTMTFGLLGQRCQGIIEMLRGVPPGIELIIGHKEHDVIAAMLACSFTGRPFVFVDRSNPPRRLARITSIARSSHALVASSDIEMEDAVTVDMRSIANRAYVNSPVPDVPGSELFYIIFTSGSTGEPKGVPISRDNYAAFYGWYGPLYRDLSGGGAHVNHASLAFDMAMVDLWATLAAGNPLIMLDHRNNIFARKNIKLLTASGTPSPSSWFSTPSLLQVMCTDLNFNAGWLPNLKCFFVGGEIVHRSLVKDLLVRFPEAQVCHAYGPSEVTCMTHVRVLTQQDIQSAGLLPLGQVFAPNMLRIIADDGREAAIGEIGEVELLGPQVISNYLPEDHPRNAALGSYQGVRTYRTGDFGHLDETGSLTLIGRIDRQVKWNGNRIELNEIERVAHEIEGILQAACIPVVENGKVANIVLFAQLQEHRCLSREDILSRLREILPATMVPRDLRFVSRLPVTVNGKVDCQELLREHAFV